MLNPATLTGSQTMTGNTLINCPVHDVTSENRPDDDNYN